jgi:peptidyl-prolyl cis-trans isomerase A (cyclophilin A)
MFTLTTKYKTKKLLSLMSIAMTSLVFTHSANATIVEIKTSLSDASIKVNLYDTTTPVTVTNFLDYVTDNYYTNTVVHRVAPDFVVQGGGFVFSGELPFTALVPNDPIQNEPIYSNVKGTISMAKQGGAPNSATSQWFFNLADNSSNLDRQNGGFTVFGQVIEGIDIVEQIALLKLCDAGSLQGIPVVIGADEACTDLTALGQENFVTIEYVNIIDSSAVTDSDLKPLITKYPDSDGDGVKDVDDTFPSDPTKTEPESVSEDNGGSISWLALAMLALLSSRKRFIKR